MNRKLAYAAMSAAVLAGTALTIAACTDADVVSQRLSKDADYFKVERRITFYNGFTGDTPLVITGKCSLGNMDKPRELTVTCKDGADSYKKHFLGLSSTVTYIVEQIEPNKEDPFHYEFVIKPAAVIPDLRLRTQP